MHERKPKKESKTDCKTSLDKRYWKADSDDTS